MLFIKTEVQSSKKKFYNKDIIINKKYVFFKIDKNIIIILVLDIGSQGDIYKK